MVGTVVAGEAEPLLDRERDFHRVEAVHAELHERRLGDVLALGERPLELLLDDLRDGRLRLGLHLRRSNSAGGGRRRELVRPRAEEEVMRDERRLLARRVGVVPLFEPVVDRLARRLGRCVGRERFERDGDPPPRREDEQVREPEADRLRRGSARAGGCPSAQLNMLPQSPRVRASTTVTFGHRGEHVGGGPRAAELLGAVAREPAARPEDDVLARARSAAITSATASSARRRPPRWP